MLTPSLYALYKQGRFRKREFDDTDQGMQQKERFAVAMLALILTHDLEFRMDFLREVCGRGQTAKPEAFLALRRFEWVGIPEDGLV